MVSLTYNLLDINISLISFGKNFTFPCNSSDIYFKNLLGIVIFSEMKITVQNQWFCSSAENMKLADNTNKLFLLLPAGYPFWNVVYGENKAVKK